MVANSQDASIERTSPSSRRRPPLPYLVAVANTVVGWSPILAGVRPVQNRQMCWIPGQTATDLVESPEAA